MATYKCQRCRSVFSTNVAQCPRCKEPRPFMGWQRDKHLGSIILGSLKITRPLGEGGSGVVYLAEDIVTGEQVAIKFLHGRFAKDERIIKRFKIEALATKSLAEETPQIVKTYAVGKLDSGEHYMTMEYVRGVPLSRIIHKQGTLPLDFALLITKEIAKALAATHAVGIVHRDLKPGNVIVLKERSTATFLKVLDFGFAKVVLQELFDAESDTTKDGLVIGTPTYMSVEQIRGAKDIDGRSDIYSLGVMLYKMLTGRAPFEAKTIPALFLKHQEEEAPIPSDIAPEGTVPPWVDKLVMTMLAKRRTDRYATADELIQAIDRQDPDAGLTTTKGRTMFLASEQLSYLKDLEDEVEDIGVLLEGARPNRTWLWISLVVAGLLLGGGIIYLLVG